MGLLLIYSRLAPAENQTLRPPPLSPLKRSALKPRNTECVKMSVTINFFFSVNALHEYIDFKLRQLSNFNSPLANLLIHYLEETAVLPDVGLLTKRAGSWQGFISNNTRDKKHEIFLKNNKKWIKGKRNNLSRADVQKEKMETLQPNFIKTQFQWRCLTQ